MTDQDRVGRDAIRARRKKQIMRRRRIFSSCVAVLVILVGVGAWWLLSGAGNQNTEGSGGGLTGGKPEQDSPVELTISSVGDVMVHKAQLTAQYDSSTKTYSFDNNFQYVKKYIEAADLALCNVETTFGGGTYSGYPAFNSPDALADALKNAGFDVAFTANNHMMDTGFSGMQRTIQVLRDAGLSVAGSHLKGETQKYVMQEVKGLKIAVAAYTYETPGVNGRRTINGNPLTDEAKSCINSFSYSSLDADLADLQSTIDTARADGADIVVAYFHWGEEYQRTPNDWQQRIARKAADMGADMVFASHPHVLQAMEMIETTGDTPRKVPVIYSMGNFLSNQRTETLDKENSRYTEQGVIANVHLKYSKSEGKITDISMDAMPTWLDKFKTGGKVNYAMVPLDGDMENNAALKASGHLSRAKQALSDETALFGEDHIAK